jgi:hypothetical protein
VSTGDFHGLRTEVVETEHLRVEVAADAGPRVVRLSTPGGTNVFAETPNSGWDTVHGRPFKLLGGHRLWSAPECPLAEQVPDDEPVDVRVDGATVTAQRGARELELRLADDGPRVRVRHVLTNDSSSPVRVAAWALTQLRPGGIAVVPLGGSGGPEQLPDRNIVLWPYSSLEDPRFALTDRELRVQAKPGESFFKVGCLNARERPRTRSMTRRSSSASTPNRTPSTPTAARTSRCTCATSSSSSRRSVRCACCRPGEGSSTSRSGSSVPDDNALPISRIAFS